MCQLCHYISSWLLSDVAFAGSAMWANIPTNLNWNQAGNWVPATVPNGPADTATIGASFAHAISVVSDTEVDGLVFTPDATGQYAITTNAGNSLTFSGVGITNNSPTTHNFVSNATLSFQGRTQFTNSASAGVMTAFITAGGDTSGGSGGMTQFNDTSTANSADFQNGGGTVSGAHGGITQFLNNSTAENGVFTNNGPVVVGADGGVTEFRDNSTAGRGVFNNRVSGVMYFTGVTRFLGTSTADQGVFINDGAVTAYSVAPIRFSPTARRRAMATSRIKLVRSPTRGAEVLYSKVIQARGMAPLPLTAAL